jgi:hypothetical protein
LNYIDDIAKRIQAQLADEAIPDDEPESLMRLYALLALTKGIRVTAEDVHNAWSVWSTDRGEWDHESLVPFSDLSSQAQHLDDQYVAAIRRAAEQLRGHA